MLAADPLDGLRGVLHGSTEPPWPRAEGDTRANMWGSPKRINPAKPNA